MSLNARWDISILAPLVHRERENILLDARSEKALFGGVMDEIDRLKLLIDKLEPKRERW